MLRKKLSSVILIGVLLLISIVILRRNDCPPILCLPGHTTLARQQFKKGDSIRPLERLDFDNGEWTAFISISSTDRSRFSSALPDGRWLKSCDVDLLKQMQREWVFSYSGGDLGTVESFIIIRNEDSVVFHSGIVLEDDFQGLQSKDYGWLRSPILLRSCSRFEALCCPLVVL